MPCQCLTKKGAPCKTPPRQGDRFCWRHKKKCDKEVTEILQIPRVPLPIAIGQIPPPLIKRAVVDIADKIEEGDTVTVATAKTLDDLVDALGLDDVTDLHSLTEEEMDYFIGTLLLHENKDKLADVVAGKIEEQNLRDPHAIRMLKSRELLNALAGKFCRCIKKVMDGAKDGKMTEGIAIAICRKGVVQGRGLAFPKFTCKTYPDPGDKSKYEDTPLFLPSKLRKKILEKHPGYLVYLSEVIDGDLESFHKLKKVDKNKYLSRK